MGNTQSYVVSSLSAFSVYLVYVHIYCSYKRLKTNVHHSEQLPTFLYLSIRYLSRCLSRRRGHLCAARPACECVRTAVENRLQTAALRSFCGAAGYGWDYPDTEFRDLPLCFPQLLCGRLLLMLITDENFRLSPAGLLLVRQSLKTLEPVDEIKKGPFLTQVRVLQYRNVDAGVEADVGLSVTACTGRPVWESVLTLRSTNTRHHEETENDSDPPSGKPVDMKQVDLRVPWSAGLPFVWGSSGYSPCWILPLLTRLCGDRSQVGQSLWVLSVCLAEIEKHKGVDVITAPVNISVRFKKPLLVPGKVTVGFWEPRESGGQVNGPCLRFDVKQHGSKMQHVEGVISRS